MVGLATLLFLLSLWYSGVWLFKRRLPKSRIFLYVAAAAGVLSVVTLEAGWVVTEVGRQPWIVRNYMKVEQAATGNTEVWITFFAVLVIYVGGRRLAGAGAAADEPAVAAGRARRPRRPLRPRGRAPREPAGVP